MIKYDTRFYAAINKNEDTRLTSTSGGVFYLLAKYVLLQKGIVYGAAYNNEQLVSHIKIDTVEDICKLQGAKYAPSSIKNVFKEIKNFLDDDILILFSGTPCQINGLRNYLKKDYRNLILVDLVCHGTPDIRAWKNYLLYRKEVDKQEEIATNINMRSKESGWSRYNYSVSFKYSSGFEYRTLNSEDPYMQAFVSNLILRESCNNCRNKGVERESDFTLGDFWGVWDYYPMLDDNKGTSLVMIHSKKGEQIWEKLFPLMIVQEINQEMACAQNGSIISSSSIHPKRDEILSKIDEEGCSVVEHELIASRKNDQSNRFVLTRKIINKVRKIFKTVEY